MRWCVPSFPSPHAPIFPIHTHTILPANHGKTSTTNTKTQGAMSRHINFQFMNRQLLWEHFTQLALCVVPLVDWDGLRRQVSGLIRQRRLMYVNTSYLVCGASFYRHTNTTTAIR